MFGISHIDIAGLTGALESSLTHLLLGTAQMAESNERNVVVQYLEDGGWMMYVILAASIVGLIVFLERSFDLYVMKRLNAKVFVAKIITNLEHKHFRQALDECQRKTKHPLVTVMKAGLLRANRREKEIERAIEDQLLSALPALQKRIALMALLANIATLLGLLGTIFGLISAFTSVSAASAAERQTALASGISQAMYTTAFGISVAVPLLFFHHILSKRMESIILQVEGGAVSLMVALTGVAREGSKGPSAS